MKKTLLLPLGIVLGLCVSATSVAVQGVTWKAELVSSQEIPKQVVKNSHAQGTFLGTFTGSKLHYKLTFSGLTGPATAAHIHLGVVGKSGKVVVPLCAPCKSPVTGSVTVSSALRNDFNKHSLYVNVHTAKNPNGEIRGQLGTAVPA